MKIRITEANRKRTGSTYERKPMLLIRYEERTNRGDGNGEHHAVEDKDRRPVPRVWRGGRGE